MDKNIQIFEIPECNLPELQKEIASLQRRAAKLQTPPISIVISAEAHLAERIVPWTKEEEYIIQQMAAQRILPPEPKRVMLKCRNVTVTGQSPKLDGWRFGATLDHLPGGAGTLLRQAPGESIKAEDWAKAKPYCSHCKTQRVRKDTFLLLHDDGRVAQIGRQCLKDFLGGHSDPESLARWAESLKRLQGKLGGYEVPTDFSHRYCIDLKMYLGFVASVIRTKGFMSKKHAGEANANLDESRGFVQPTSGVASCRMYMVTAKDAKKETIEAYAPTEGDKKIGEEALSWLRSIERPTGDFMVNLVTLAKADLPEVEPRHLGLLAAGVNSYIKEKELTSTRVKFNNSAHVGAAKERGVHTLTIRSRRIQEDNEGGSYEIIKFGDQAGNLFCWFTGSKLPDEAAVGTTWEVKATVKGHSEYKGIKETKLNRCVFIKKVEVAAPEFKKEAAVG